MAASREAVIVFAKFPRPGEVKTRLAASVGNVQAAAFYKHCAEAVIGELARCRHPPFAPHSRVTYTCILVGDPSLHDRAVLPAPNSTSSSLEEMMRRR